MYLPTFLVPWGTPPLRTTPPTPRLRTTLPKDHTPKDNTPCERTDTSENITFSQTSFVGGNYVKMKTEVNWERVRIPSAPLDPPMIYTIKEETWYETACIGINFMKVAKDWISLPLFVCVIRQGCPRVKRTVGNESLGRKHGF